MDATAVLIETAAAFGRHLEAYELDASGAEMFGRIFDLTIRPGLARRPGEWETANGRAYALAAVARIAREAMKMAGADRVVTGAILRKAADQIIDQAREKANIPKPPAIVTVFCFAYELEHPASR